MDKTALIAAAKELNHVLGLDPPIDLGGGVDELRAELLDVMELITPEDSFTPDTTSVLSMLSGNGASSEQVDLVQRNDVGVTQSPKVEAKEEKKPELEEKPKPKSKLKTKTKPKGKERIESKPVQKEKELASKRTRSEIMSEILSDSIAKPMSKDEMVIRMYEAYGGSELSAKINVEVALRLLKALRLVWIVDGKIRYLGEGVKK